jgi:glutamine synthetase
LFAGLVVAIGHGLEMPDSLKIAGNLYVNYNIFKDQKKTREKNLESLPASCWESSECLLAQRKYFEKDGIFPAGVIDNTVAKLKAYNDKDLSERLFNKNDEIRKLVREYLHYC